jgi:hypothetical protein
VAAPAVRCLAASTGRELDAAYPHAKRGAGMDWRASENGGHAPRNCDARRQDQI